MPNKFIANGFSTILPDGWADRSVLTLVSQASSEGFATNVVILRQEVSAAESIEDYARQQLRLAAEELEDFEMLDERPTTIQGKPAYQALHRFTTRSAALQQAQTFILHDRTVLVFTCTALVEEFNASIAAFRQVMDNLVFED